MKTTYSLAAVLEKAIGIQNAVAGLYKEVSEAAPEGTREVFDYLVKAKEGQTRGLSALSPEADTIAVDGYTEKYNIYIAPYLGPDAVSGLKEALDGIDRADIASVMGLALSREKENLLLYQGLGQLLAGEAGSVMERIIEEQRADILSLYDGIRELNENVDDYLMAAMRGELLAKRFYENAAAKARSETGRQLFEELAGFENAHFEHIKAIIESRNQGIQIEIPDLPEEAWGEQAGSEGEVEPNRDEVVEIISMAIDAEKTARLRYDKIAAMLDDPQDKKIFENLANSERVHQKILEDQFYQLSNKGMIIWGD